LFIKQHAPGKYQEKDSHKREVAQQMATTLLREGHRLSDRISCYLIYPSAVIDYQWLEMLSRLINENEE
jgi:hypothetical protein